jgi:DNA-binding transcriptional ArsR family regulator
MRPDTEAIAEQVFVALADPSRRAILAALASGGPATATDLAGRLPITRQAIAKHLALLAEAGLVMAEPGERRRVRYRLRSAPMQVAQQFLAALARDWDGPLDALRDHLDRRASQVTALSLHERKHGTDPEGGHHDEDSLDRHAAGVGGGAPAAAGEGEGTDPRQGRAGR